MFMFLSSFFDSDRRRRSMYMYSYALSPLTPLSQKTRAYIIYIAWICGFVTTIFIKFW